MVNQPTIVSPPPKPTGRQLVFFNPQTDFTVVKSAVQKAIGRNTVNSRDFQGNTAQIADVLTRGDAVYVERFRVAAIDPSKTGINTATLQTETSVLQVRPEFYMFAINDLQRRYAAWAREGLAILAEGVTGSLASTSTLVTEARVSGAPFADTDESTWGLIAIGAAGSAFSGRGLRIAVLDTGLDLEHPDFVNRNIQSRSFVPNETVDDQQGHGTHTAGTIAGPRVSRIGRRYGVAPDVELFAGKVLNNSGSGRELDILEGMNWAIDNQCIAISMSLGRPVAPGEQPDPMYEEVGLAALRAGSLIIAAAGNDSARGFGFIAPVGAPANSPSIMAVAAVDPTLKVAQFSSGGINPNGGEVNISGPGVSVYSSFPRPQLSKVLQGTSMACPHVAGIAALFAESDASLRGEKLWRAMERSARDLGNIRDFGRGLVQAPDAEIGA
jgi:subtilisin family serine protease